MRGAIFVGCVLGLGLPSVALTQEFDNCVGTRFESVAELTYPSNLGDTGRYNTCDTLIEGPLGDGMASTQSYCGLGTEETKNCCGMVHYAATDAASSDGGGSFLQVFNHIKVCPVLEAFFHYSARSTRLS